ncbi:DnaA N-terminal domain-containing protein [Bacillales bacterium AN1005]
MDSEKLNLKGKNDKLEYYRTIDTGNLVLRMKLVKQDESKLTYYVPEQDKVVYSEKEVRKFSLDAYGENIPYIDGELTILNNYLFDYWGYFINAEGLALYAHLKRYAYGNKDWCFPNFEMISLKMDKSRPTIHAYLEILERYGFVYKFNVINRSREKEEGPIFKIRKKVPLLTKALLEGTKELEIPDNTPAHIKKAIKKEKEGLPKKLRVEHDKYVNEMIRNNEKINIENQMDYEEIYRVWQQYGQIVKNSNRSLAINQEVVLAYGKTEMDTHETNMLNYLLTYVAKKISKPSFDTWFKGIVLKIMHNNCTILAPNEFCKDWLENKYADLISNTIREYDKSINVIVIQQ